MNIKQSLTEYVVKEIMNYFERTGKLETQLAKECGIQPNHLKMFMLGITSIKLVTADKILNVIHKETQSI